MSAFEELKKKAETQVATDKAATESWVKFHRGWIIAVVVALITGVILAKAF